MYSKRRGIRRNHLPYSIVHNAVMDLLSNRETPAAQKDTPQLLISSAIDKDGAVATPPTPAVIQHAVPLPMAPNPAGKPPRPRIALIPVPPTVSLRCDGRERTKSSFYKPHDIRTVSEFIRIIMDRENPPPQTFPTDCDAMPPDTDIMRSYAIDTLFDSKYYTGDTEEIEIMDALRAPDSDQFISAIRKEVQSLISETRTLQPLSRTTAPNAYSENTENKRVWRICTTLKCKRKKKPYGEPDKHKARAAAREDTLRRAMIKANVPLPASYSPTIMPLTFALFLQLAVIQQLHTATMNIKSAYLNTPYRRMPIESSQH